MTDTRARILEAIEDPTRGYPPTVRELMEAAGLNSPASVQHHLDKLEADGLIVREPGLTRTIRPANAS